MHKSNMRLRFMTALGAVFISASAVMAYQGSTTGSGAATTQGAAEGRLGQAAAAGSAGAAMGATGTSAMPAQGNGTARQGGPGRGRGARGPQQRASPHETIYSRNDNNRVMIIYGRPYSHAPNSTEVRKIWGGLVPWGERYRLGSDEATILITKSPLQFGSVTVPAGAYSLYMMPVENGPSKLIINKEIGQWGIGDPYHEDMEVGRVDLKKEEIPNQVDQLTLSIDRDPAGTPPAAGSILNIVWEKTKFSVPFSVKK